MVQNNRSQSSLIELWTYVRIIDLELLWRLVTWNLPRDFSQILSPGIFQWASQIQIQNTLDWALNSLSNLLSSLPKQMVVLIPIDSLTLFSILPLSHSCQSLGVPLTFSLGPPVYTLAFQPGSLGSGNPNGSLFLLAFFQPTSCTTTNESLPKWNRFRLEWHLERWGWLPPLVFPQSFSHKAFVSIFFYSCVKIPWQKQREKL